MKRVNRGVTKAGSGPFLLDCMLRHLQKESLRIILNGNDIILVVHRHDDVDEKAQLWRKAFIDDGLELNVNTWTTRLESTGVLYDSNCSTIHIKLLDRRAVGLPSSVKSGMCFEKFSGKTIQQLVNVA